MIENETMDLRFFINVIQAFILFFSPATIILIRLPKRKLQKLNQRRNSNPMKKAIVLAVGISACLVQGQNFDQRGQAPIVFQPQPSNSVRPTDINGQRPGQRIQLRNQQESSSVARKARGQRSHSNGRSRSRSNSPSKQRRAIDLNQAENRAVLVGRQDEQARQNWAGEGRREIIDQRQQPQILPGQQNQRVQVQHQAQNRQIYNERRPEEQGKPNWAEQGRRDALENRQKPQQIIPNQLNPQVQGQRRQEWGQRRENQGQPQWAQERQGRREWQTNQQQARQIPVQQVPIQQVPIQQVPIQERNDWGQRRENDVRPNWAGRREDLGRPEWADQGQGRREYYENHQAQQLRLPGQQLPGQQIIVPGQQILAPGQQILIPGQVQQVPIGFQGERRQDFDQGFGRPKFVQGQGAWQARQIRGNAGQRAVQNVAEGRLP